MKKIIILSILLIICAIPFIVINYIRESNANTLLKFLKNLNTQEIQRIEIFNDYKKKNIMCPSLIFEFKNVFSKTEKWEPHQPLLDFFYYLVIILENGDKYKFHLRVSKEASNNIVYIYYGDSFTSGARYKNSKLYDWLLKVVK